MNDLREKIIAECGKRGWNRMTLSNESGVSYAQVHSFFAGGVMRVDTLEKICGALGLELTVKRRRKRK